VLGLPVEDLDLSLVTFSGSTFEKALEPAWLLKPARDLIATSQFGLNQGYAHLWNILRVESTI
jgi:hypothetical protein